MYNLNDRHSVVLRGLHTENGMVVGGGSNSTTDQLIGFFFATPITTIVASGKGLSENTDHFFAYTCSRV